MRTFTSVFIRAKAKKTKAFRCFATVRKHRIFSAQSAHGNWCGHARMVWHTYSTS